MIDALLKLSKARTALDDPASLPFDIDPGRITEYAIGQIDDAMAILDQVATLIGPAMEGRP